MKALTGNEFCRFPGGANILWNSSNNDFDEFYVVEKNFMFKREEIVDHFLEIFMAHENGKIDDNHVKNELFWV
jgi:hypothetical protein